MHLSRTEVIIMLALMTLAFIVGFVLPDDLPWMR